MHKVRFDLDIRNVKFDELILMIIGQVTFKYRGVDPSTIQDWIEVRVPKPRGYPYLKDLAFRGQELINQTKFYWNLDHIVYEANERGEAQYALVFAPKNLLEMFLYA
jgi:hypothetical protein